MTDTFRPLKIWCLLRDQFAHVKPVEEYFGARAAFFYDGAWVPEKMVQECPDFVLCVNDWPYDIARCLDAARQARIPSLVLQDGILEWRCQYENPKFGAGGGAPQHQPVLADKIACIGSQSARQIAAWGNAAKVEVTGMSKFDPLLGISFSTRQQPGKRLLVMTAKKPWFYPLHREVILRSLKDLKNYLDSRPDIQTVWRVTKDIETLLHVHNTLKELSTGELVETLGQVDAVITTPSTTILESMLLDRPVAALDYFNVPRFVPTAWTISAPEHIPVVLGELLDPSYAKMAFQSDCLKDCLACGSPAAPRLATLIAKMVEISRNTKLSGELIQYPPDMLGTGIVSQHGQKTLNIDQLYPGNPDFGERNIETLRVRLARLRKENEMLREELQTRGLGYWLAAGGRFLGQKLTRRG
jgi:hypothetical protein